MEQFKELQEKAKLVRKWCMVSTTEAGWGRRLHVCLPRTLQLLFDRYFTYDINNPLNLYKDRSVLSKGHAAPLLYTLFGVAVILWKN